MVRAARPQLVQPEGGWSGVMASRTRPYCLEGSHLATYDDQQAYFAGLISFLHDLAGASCREEGPAWREPPAF